MGRKKSVVLMVLLTIVIVALCALTVFPAFTFPWDPIKGWQPAVASLDAGTELQGGYYTYYYPEGIISSAEYENDLEGFTEGSAEQTEYKNRFERHKGLWLEKDRQFGIFEDEENTATEVEGIANVSESFKAEFAAVTEEISSRFAKKGFSQYRVAVVDDYVLRIETPASAGVEMQFSYSNILSSMDMFHQLGGLSLKKGTEEIDGIDDEAPMTDYISGFSVETEYDTAFLVVTLTDEGETVLGDIKDSLSTSGTSSGTFLNFHVGDNTNALLSVGKDNFMSDMRIKYPLLADSGKAHVETYAILLNSALETGGFDFEFSVATVYQMEESDNMTFVFIAIGIVLLACLILPIIFCGKYGVTSAYTTLSYLIIAGLCFVFISGSFFEITLGSLLTFLFGLVLTNLVNAYVYTAIKKEFLSGKTVQSAVKKGYGKTLWHIIDTYAVLLIGALLMLIGGGGLHVMALQMLICLVTAAFNNLLWGRGINYVFLSACKDKYKYFRFVREDDDDDEE